MIHLETATNLALLIGSLFHRNNNKFNQILLHLCLIERDPETGNSRGFGFISYDSFEASDAAIEAMNGQYLCNRQITVSYAYKKDTKGERQYSHDVDYTKGN